MRGWAKLGFAIAAPLFLASCLWGPGKFNSTLVLSKNGTFALDYRGEILLQLPEDKGSQPEPWNDKMCVPAGKTQINVLQSEKAREARPCGAAEIAKQKAEHESKEAERIAKKREENEQMAKLFGLPGADEESNRAFVAKLMKYQGWRSVTYKGKGVFDVDYHLEGRTSQDFAFPLMPDSDTIIPFITIRRRTDGTVLVTAPAFTGGSGPFGVRARMMGLPDKGSDGPQSRAEGRFTILTDGEILTNNSEDGPAAHASGRQVHWDVGPASAKMPEMLVRL